MSKKSNNQGRAYEFAYILALDKEISKYRTVTVNKGNGYIAAQNAWNTLDDEMKSMYEVSAKAGIKALFDCEPLILEIKNNNDKLCLCVQTDDQGKVGDVRDILIIRQLVNYEVGLSIKHNHFAVKHSRISKTNNWGQDWYGIPCSENYCNEVAPIFEMLEEKKQQKIKWSEIDNKDEDVYKPILLAFKNEILKQNKICDNQLVIRLIEYLLGRHDFYKLISVDSEESTQLQSFNLKGSLNKKGEKAPKQYIPKIELPSRIVYFDLVPNSNNTLELYLDKGWQFTFRIHNAETTVNTSLKFDIQLVGMPTKSVITLNYSWY